MQCGLYVEREQLLAKKSARAVVRAGPFLKLPREQRATCGAYIVTLLGKNGEGIANRDLALALRSRAPRHELKLALTTDKLDRVYMPHLPLQVQQSYVRIQARCAPIAT